MDHEAGVAQPSPSPPRVVVFDFDGTLVNRDSFLDFSVRYCIARPGRLVIVIAMLPLAMLALARSRKSAASILLWAMTVGSSSRRFVIALRHYARDTLSHHANEATFQELTLHLQQGHRVVIATGTSPVLVRGLLNARRLGRLPVAGSLFRRRCRGLLVETYCTGSTKLDELDRRFGIADWSVVYTNSFSDRWLLSRAEEVILVAPSERSLLRTRRWIASSTALRVLRSGSSKEPPGD